VALLLSVKGYRAIGKGHTRISVFLRKASREVATVGWVDGLGITDSPDNFTLPFRCHLVISS